MKTEKEFFLVVNDDGDAYEAVFKTHAEAMAYRQTRESQHPNINLEIQKRSLSRDVLDYILEAEGTEKLWGEPVNRSEHSEPQDEPTDPYAWIEHPSRRREE